MLTLGIDTTAVSVSAALTEGGRILGTVTYNTAKNHSELLLPMIDGLLGAFGYTVADIGLMAASVGPGSFTGVRVGVSMLKGLAWGGTPCAPVSTLEALAENLRGVDGLVVPVMDARRSQLYTALFRGGARITEDALLTAAELREMLEREEGPVYFVGDGYDVARRLIDLPTIRETPSAAIRQNAASVALVGERMHADGNSVQPEELRPIYLRASQAERERNERLSAEQKGN